MLRWERSGRRVGRPAEEEGSRQGRPCGTGGVCLRAASDCWPLTEWTYQETCSRDSLFPGVGVSVGWCPRRRGRFRLLPTSSGPPPEGEFPFKLRSVAPVTQIITIIICRSGKHSVILSRPPEPGPETPRLGVAGFPSPVRCPGREAANRTMSVRNATIGDSITQNILELGCSSAVNNNVG